jgi:TfoX/Sxy family transcriptional regulator of competence genes
MAWKQADESLRALLESALSEEDFKEQKMYGLHLYSVNDTIFAGIGEDTLFLRLDDDTVSQFESEYGYIRAYEPEEGSVLEGFYKVPEIIIEREPDLMRMIKAAYNYAVGNIAQ